MRWVGMLIAFTVAVMALRALATPESRQRVAETIDRLTVALAIFMILGAAIRLAQYYL